MPGTLGVDLRAGAREVREPVGGRLELVGEEAAAGDAGRCRVCGGEGAGAVDEVGGVNNGSGGDALDGGTQTEEEGGLLSGLIGGHTSGQELAVDVDLRVFIEATEFPGDDWNHHNQKRARETTGAACGVAIRTCGPYTPLLCIEWQEKCPWSLPCLRRSHRQSLVSEALALPPRYISGRLAVATRTGKNYRFYDTERYPVFGALAGAIQELHESGFQILMHIE